ncbi:MAG: hypothetical protein JSU04_00135 [Bdellovibrionales bacterium]|nr:hypothetical protein [Bdellovibrionales bacterium]
MKEYALYKGEDVIAVGTIHEIAAKTNVKPDTIRFYTSPAYERRLAARKDKNARRMVCTYCEVEDDEQNRNSISDHCSGIDNSGTGDTEPVSDLDLYNHRIQVGSSVYNHVIDLLNVLELHVATSRR